MMMASFVVVVDNGSQLMKHSVITVSYDVLWHDAVVRPSLRLVVERSWIHLPVVRLSHSDAGRLLMYFTPAT